ncbi:DUF3941 domain-containing protein [Fictibacillus phosphorivorans]|nr:DUF3941 domain-containing protein [Fictibacillus phosphorivorans]MCM3719082.1 DUF3941 domain-containing protein [Fictibacillus phosphorivorans]MCM3776704.1 DUF3941 domain-containing protein [Fictibacillus phosphorivorans]
MTHKHRYTKDDDKKPVDNQARNKLNNVAEHEIREKGKQPYSKKPDHL